MKCHGVYGALLLLVMVLLLAGEAAAAATASTALSSAASSSSSPSVGTLDVINPSRRGRGGGGVSRQQQGFSPLRPARGKGREKGGSGAGGGGGRQWCASEDPGTRAFLASTVFEGKARSVGPGSAAGSYSVTFVVQRVYKDSSMLKVRAQVRLQFPSPSAPVHPRRRHHPACRDGRLPLPPGGAGGAGGAGGVRRGGKFLVFADRLGALGAHNLTARGSPLPRSRAAVLAIRAALCHNCARPPSVWGLRDASVAARGRLRLLCRTEGSPAPAVSWYKDGRRIAGSRRLRIRHNRRKSVLVITRARPADSGRYECRAVSPMGMASTAAATVTVRHSNTTALWPLLGRPCFLDTYCLNGGTCTYYETVGELVCQCSDGYKGQRCESKDVSSRGSMSYLCKLGISASYYC